MNIGPDDVVSFWFGELRADGTVEPKYASRWWSKDPAFDARLRERFGEARSRAMRGLLAWNTPVGTLARIILLDQVSRNIGRDTPAMYEADPKAVGLALGLLDNGSVQDLPVIYQVFVFMPLMHAEDVKLQNRCVSLFQKAADMAHGPLEELLQNYLDYAIRHRDIVQQFGRFPHRNDVLGRESTPEEVAFLAEPGSSF